jgi:hypothetical protein
MRGLTKQNELRATNPIEQWIKVIPRALELNGRRSDELP